MHASKKMETVRMHDAVSTHRYEVVMMYISLFTFLAMAGVFLLILSL